MQNLILSICFCYLFFGSVQAQNAKVEIGLSTSFNMVAANTWNEGFFNLYQNGYLWHKLIIDQEIIPIITIPYSARYGAIVNIPLSKRFGVSIKPAILHHGMTIINNYIGGFYNYYAFTLQAEGYYYIPITEFGGFQAGASLGLQRSLSNDGKIGSWRIASGSSTNNSTGQTTTYYEAYSWQMKHRKPTFYFIEASMGWKTQLKSEKDKLYMGLSFNVPIQNAYYYKVTREYSLNNAPVTKLEGEGNTFKSYFGSFTIAYLRAF